MSETQEQLYYRAKRLVGADEWKSVEEYLKSVADVHRMDASNLLAHGKVKDAERQAWIAEGIEEAVRTPQELVVDYESMTGKFGRFCALCGHKVGEYVKGKFPRD